MADDKGRPIHVNIRRARVSEREVVQVSRASGNFDAGCAGRIGVELEARVGNASLRRTHPTVDGDIAPVAARPETGEENRRVRHAFGEQASAIGDCHALADFKANDRTRLNGQGYTRIDRNGIGHHIMHT